MVEFYRDYFVRRKAPWLCGRWEAILCRQKPQEILGEGQPPRDILNGIMGKPTFRALVGAGVSTSFPNAMLFHTTKGKSLRTQAGVKSEEELT